VTNPERDPADVFRRFVERRRAKIRDEIERNRRGEYTVPTWVLAVILLLIIAFCVSLFIF
jgi:hypothetical protein